MITINILCTGKLKEKSLQDLTNEYEKRLSKYCKLNILEVEDEKIPIHSSLSIEEMIREKEGKRMLEKIEKLGRTSVILLDLQGKCYTSEEFSDKLTNITLYQNSSITFVIGGSLGLSKQIKELFPEKISFSKMTFPHQLFRVLLLEQIFRAFKIKNHETYHH